MARKSKAASNRTLPDERAERSRGESASTPKSRRSEPGGNVRPGTASRGTTESSLGELALRTAMRLPWKTRLIVALLLIVGSVLWMQFGPRRDARDRSGLSGVFGPVADPEKARAPQGTDAKQKEPHAQADLDEKAAEERFPPTESSPIDDADDELLTTPPQVKSTEPQVDQRPPATGDAPPRNRGPPEKVAAQKPAPAPPAEQPTDRAPPSRPAPPQAKPADAKPADTKPAEPKPVVIENVTLKDRDNKVVYRGKILLQPTLDRIAAGKRLGFPNDGVTFQNRERRLPQKPSGYYREWVHPTEGLSGPGPQRVVTGKGGEIWYTHDHYRSFKRIK